MMRREKEIIILYILKNKIILCKRNANVLILYFFHCTLSIRAFFYWRTEQSRAEHKQRTLAFAFFRHFQDLNLWYSDMSSYSSGFLQKLRKGCSLQYISVSEIIHHFIPIFVNPTPAQLPPLSHIHSQLLLLLVYRIKIDLIFFSIFLWFFLNFLSSFLLILFYFSHYILIVEKSFRIIETLDSC